MTLTTNPQLKQARFSLQKAEAIKLEQIERCYRQYLPPQIKYRPERKNATA